MLELKNVGKIYGTGENKVEALKKVNLAFRKSEFVSVLGHSGCGKTTLLNLLGGLDKYTSGQLVINGVTTKDFTDKHWDAYRNNSVGFVFQSYNLIPHLTVLGNVEIAMTLSGVTPKERKARALQALDEVGIKDKANKKPNQLSGGQMQRVAIARAIVNQPSIILADEPTGALDTDTSRQVIEIIEKLSKDRLVIMVTHNNEIAEQYSTRIIKLVDGQVEEDSHPLTEIEYKQLKAEDKKVKVTAKKVKSGKAERQQKRHNKKLAKLNFKKTSMSFFTAISLSFKNLLTKKLRTMLVAFAGSIGIIGVTLVLAVSNGFNIYLNNFQRTALMSLPIQISTISYNIDMDALTNINNRGQGDQLIVVPKNDKTEGLITARPNNITTEYLEYLNQMNTHLFANDTASYANVVYNRDVNKLIFNSKMEALQDVIEFTPLINNDEYLNKHLKVIAGNLPNSYDEVVLIVNADNQIDAEFLAALGYEIAAGEEISAGQLLEHNPLKLLSFDDWYLQGGTPNAYVTNTQSVESLLEDAPPIKIVGVVQTNPSDDVGVFARGNAVGHLYDLDEHIYDQNKNSPIATYLKDNQIITLDGKMLPEQSIESKHNALSIKSQFAATEIPLSIYVYPQDFQTKDSIKAYLDDYNNNIANAADHILYVDQAEIISTMFGEMLDIVSIVLIAFSGISLVVSSIMIGIITYISVIERTKEIGVLRSMGARKKDIARVFLAESLIIGVTAGVLGVFISVLLTLPINSIVAKQISVISKIAIVSPFHAVFMITLSAILTLVAGVIPAYIASQRDPVVALRTE